MSARRPIAAHPGFAAFIALWFAALLGLGTAVLPPAMIARGWAALGWPVAGPAQRIIACLAAALAGAALGTVIAALLRARSRRDTPRHDDEDEAPPPELAELPSPRRRPLHVREELGDDFADPGEAAWTPIREAMAEPPRCEPDQAPREGIAALLARFDAALAHYAPDGRGGAGEGGRDDSTPAPIPPGATDNQAQLRAVLDRIAEFRRER